MTMTDRWFVRCADCLSVGAVEQQPPMVPHTNRTTWKCGVCAGPVELMGKVQRDALLVEREAAPCDARCTHARGPICVCKCSCVNHGTGRLVKIVTEQELPVVAFTDAEKALAQVTDYRSKMLVIEAAMKDSATVGYNRFWYINKLVNKVKEARKFETRMKRLKEVAEKLGLKLFASEASDFALTS